MKPIDLLGFGPKREAVQQLDGNWKITVTPPETTGLLGSSMVLTPDQYNRYMFWRARKILIQDALPELTNAEREILMTGIGPKEFDELFRKDEEYR